MIKSNIKIVDQKILDKNHDEHKSQAKSYQISFEESKSRHFDTYQEMIETLRKAIKKSYFKNALSSISNDHSNSKIIKANATIISDAILSNCDVSVKRTRKGNIFFIQDPITRTMRSDEQYIVELLTNICSNQIEDSGIEIHDISKMKKDVLVKLKNDLSVRDFVEAPKTYIVMKNGIVIDVIKREAQSLETFSKLYDITKINNVNFLSSQFSDQTESKRIMNQQIINRVMRDWSSGESDVENLLWQIIYAVLIGKNFDKFIILQGPGGNGKSTFMNLLSKLVGQDFTIYTNIHQFGDPNSINSISKSTQVIIGDDAATNHKISDVALSNLKSIVTGDPISLPVKYSENAIVQTDALFVQGTNTDISFYENNPAIKSRALVINWTTLNYREEMPSDITFNLDELMSNQDFIDEWATTCIEKIEYFKKFDIPESVKKSTDEMVESNDAIKQFLDEFVQSIDGFESIPEKVFHHCFLDWSKRNNPSAGIMKARRFYKELESKLKFYQLKMDNSSKRSKFRSHPNKNSICQLLNINKELFSEAQRLIFSTNQLTSEDFIEVSSLEIDILNDRQLQAAAILAFDQNNSSIISKYGHQLTD